MSRLLLTVEDSFAIEGRGVVLLPKLEPVGDEVFRAGDPIRIHRPDGTNLHTTMKGIEFLTTTTGSFLVILLPKNIAKLDVPIGSEVWLCSTELQPSRGIAAEQRDEGKRE